MAGKVVDITIRAVDGVSRPLSGITSKLTESARQWQRAGRQIQNVGRGIKNVGDSMTKTLTVPIVGAGAVAVKKFAEVDKTMSLVNATMNNTSDEAETLDKAMSEAAANSTFGMNDAAQAALNFARGGWDANQAANALAPAMNLAAGAGGDLDTVSAGLMATMNAFKAPAEDAGKYADMFANACNNSALDVNSLSESMSVAAPIFQTSGGSLKDATLAMGIMANNGTNANVAANSLKTGIARLASPAKDGAVWMEKLGVNIFDASGNMKSMEQVQSDLHKAFGNLNAQEKEAAAAAMFGKNQMAPWLSLIEAAPKDVNKLSNALNEQKTAISMATAMMEGFGGSIEKLKSSLDVFMTNMGKTIADVLTPYVKRIQGIMDKFNSLNESQRQMIVKVALFVAAVGPLLSIFGSIIIKVGMVVSTIGKLGMAIKAAGGVMALLTGPAGIAVAVVAGLAIAAVLVYKNWNKVKQVLVSVGKYIQSTLNHIGLSHDQVGTKGTRLVSTFNRMKNSLIKMWPVIKPAVMRIAEILKFVFVTRWKAILGAAIGFIGAFARNITEVLRDVMNVIASVADFVTAVAHGDWKSAWEAFKSILIGVVSTFDDVVKAPINAVIGIINGALNSINGISVSIPDWVPNVGGQTFSVHIPTIPQLAIGTPNWIGGLAQINEKGGEIVDLPRGSRVYPHDQSIQKAYNDGKRSGSMSINIPKLADQIIVREDADIDKIAARLAHRLEISLSDAVFVG